MEQLLTYLTGKNTKSALQKTQMELAQSEKEFRIINEELAKQESIIRARENVVIVTKYKILGTTT